MAHRLEHAGRTITVESDRRGLSTAVTAYADGGELGHGLQDGLEPVRIPLDADWTIEADSWLPGRLSRCELKRGDLAVPFAPPPGTRAARLARLRETHPRAWAARHVAVAVLQVLATVLGIGLLVRGLLPRIDISLPRIDLPDLPLPDLLGWVPDIHIPAPNLPDLPDLHTAYWLPVVLAIGAAVRELRRRRAAQAAKRAADAAAARTVGDAQPAEPAGDAAAPRDD